MADYYTLWSTIIKDLKEEEHSWLSLIITRINTALEQEDTSLFPEFLAEHYDLEDICTEPDIKLEQRHQKRDAWFHSDGSSGDELPIHAGIIQEFLKRFRPDRAHQIHWSAGCSRPIADEAYGGGCAVITAHEIVYMTTWDWAQDKLEELGYAIPEEP